MNHASMLKWMWQWVKCDQNWWKEPTVTLGPHIRPWEMTNVLRFWTSVKTLLPIFDSSVQYQLGHGVTIQFWHNDWLQGPLKAQFPVPTPLQPCKVQRRLECRSLPAGTKTIILRSTLGRPSQSWMYTAAATTLYGLSSAVAGYATVDQTCNCYILNQTCIYFHTWHAAHARQNL
jgi:hypothetical protein